MSSPGLIRRYSDHLLRGVGRAMSRTAGIDYRWRSWMERLFFSRCEAVHDLPPIFHYWSNRYLRPKLEAIGASDPDHFFQQHLERCYDAGAPAARMRRFVSVGAGICDLEIRLAQALTASGRDRFTIDCLDFNRSVIGRASRCPWFRNSATSIDGNRPQHTMPCSRIIRCIIWLLLSPCSMAWRNASRRTGVSSFPT